MGRRQRAAKVVTPTADRLRTDHPRPETTRRQPLHRLEHRHDRLRLSTVRYPVPHVFTGATVVQDVSRGISHH